MRPELLVAKSRVDEKLRALDREEGRLMSESDLDEALSRVKGIATERAALTAQAAFLQRTMDLELARDQVDVDAKQRRSEEDREEERFETSRRNKRRAEDGMPVLRDVGGFPGPGTWPTDVRR